MVGTSSTSALMESPLSVGAPKALADAQLAANVRLIERAVAVKDTKLLVGRLLRQTASLRSQLTASLLHTFLEANLPAQSATKAYLQDSLRKNSSGMDVDTDGVDVDQLPLSDQDQSLLPELEAYTFLLVITYLIDRRQFHEAKGVTSTALKRLGEYNRRTLDGITSKIYFLHSWAHENTGSLSEIRGQLLNLHRTAVLRHDDYGQETLLNLLLRNCLHYNLYDQAEKLRSKAQKNEVWRSNQQLCRYLFYLGKIKAIQLGYSEAKDFLTQASRKAPVVASGFQVIVTKWLIVVKLLLGDIPERLDFQQPGLQKPLRPYFNLTQAVRIGDLASFVKVADEYEGTFRQDGTSNLITRLRHNVIKTGLRRISLAYSRISLQDIANKLSLSCVEDTESILAKAITDGGIEATIDHKNGWVVSKQTVDVYATSEPQSAFHTRIAFCLDIHNEAVKAMQFEGLSGDKQLETAESSRNRAIQDEELAKQIQEDDDF